MTSEEIYKTIDEISENCKNDNWDGEGAKAIKKEVCEYAKNFYTYLNPNIDWDLYECNSGSICFETSDNLEYDNHIEFDIHEFKKDKSDDRIQLVGFGFKINHKPKKEKE